MRPESKANMKSLWNGLRTLPDGRPSPAGPSIYTAVQEQLGLRLEPRNVPLDYLVVDHVEKPDAN
jgi:uncharacterized protein (TIGR03435 family)